LVCDFRAVFLDSQAALGAVDREADCSDGERAGVRSANIYVDSVSADGVPVVFHLAVAADEGFFSAFFAGNRSRQHDSHSGIQGGWSRLMFVASDRVHKECREGLVRQNACDD
jgi:hypothetical protein